MFETKFSKIEDFFKNWKTNFIVSVEFSRNDKLICRISINPEHMENGFIIWQKINLFGYGDIVGFKIDEKLPIDIKIIYVEDNESIIKRLYEVIHNELVDVESYDDLIRLLSNNTKELKFNYNKNLYFKLKYNNYSDYYFQRFDSDFDLYGLEGRFLNKDGDTLTKYLESKLSIIQNDYVEEEQEISLEEMKDLIKLKKFKKSLENGILMFKFDIRFNFNVYMKDDESLNEHYKGDIFSVYFFPPLVHSLLYWKDEDTLINDESICYIPTDSSISIFYLDDFEYHFPLLQKPILEKIVDDDTEKLEFHYTDELKKIVKTFLFRNVNNNRYENLSRFR